MLVDIALVRDSFAAMRPHLDSVLDRFLEELSARDSGVSRLVSGLKEPAARRKLTAALIHVIDFYDERTHLDDYLKKAGDLYRAKGLEALDASALDAAMATTFKFLFEDQWNERLQANWSSLLAYCLERVMAGSAAESSGPPPKLPAAQSLEDVARAMALEALKRAFNEENNSLLAEYAKGKAREILRRAIEIEGAELLAKAENKEP
jgi:hypothetical protein